MSEKFIRTLFIDIDGTGNFITKKYDPKDKPEYNFKIRLMDKKWIKTICEFLNYDIEDQVLIYEKKLENDGINLPLWEKFIEWKTHADDWIIIDIFFNTIEIKNDCCNIR